MKKIYSVAIIQLFVVICLTVLVHDAGAQWVAVNGPPGTLTGNEVTCLAVSGTGASQFLFAGTSDSGVYRSSDNGTSWTALNTGIPVGAYGIYVRALHVSGANTSSPKLFVGTEDGGVYLSTNNGESWKGVNSGLTGNAITSFTENGPNSSPAIYVGSYRSGGVHRTVDFGSTWTAVNNGGDTSIVALAVSGKTLFESATHMGVFVSTNDGASWSPANTGLYVPNYTDVPALAVIGTNVFAGTYGAGVYSSADNGANWVSVDASDVIYISALAVSGTNLFSTGTDYTNVMLSTDNGTSWQKVGQTLGLAGYDNVTAMTVSGPNAPVPMLFAATSNSGVHRRPLSEMITGSSVTSATTPILAFEQNTPNPFNTSTTIRYSLASRGHVKITLSNLLGERVRTELDDQVSAGEHSIAIQATNLPSGMYLARIATGGITRSQKISILR